MNTRFYALALCALLLLVGCLVFVLYAQQPRMACVDTNQIIHLSAERFAKSELNEDQLQMRLTQFKKSLSRSLDEFAKEQGVIILPSHGVHGAVQDMTEHFIAFYNGDPEKGGQK